MNSSYIPKRCLACNYDLQGLGESPRCPECGLLNIPENYRAQVWQFVDSRRVLLTTPLGFLRRRPPGWWWALDRANDVSRSTKLVVRNILILIVCWTIAMPLSDSFRVEKTSHTYYVNRTYPTYPPVEWYRRIDVLGVGGRYIRGAHVDPAMPNDIPQDFWQNAVQVNQSIWRVFFEADVSTILHAQFLALNALLIWGLPAWVGLLTQIRKGLPSFAKPPRTILAAANHESHRLIYVGLFGVVLLTADCCVRTLLPQFKIAQQLPEWLPLIAWLFAISGWIGPLRSDYTKQLIRGPVHAIRIMIMYAVLLPPLIAIAIASLIWLAIDYTASTGWL